MKKMARKWTVPVGVLILLADSFCFQQKTFQQSCSFNIVGGRCAAILGAHKTNSGVNSDVRSTDA